MTHTDTHPPPAAAIEWRAAVIAGLIAGAVFLVLEMALVALSGDSPWAPPRMIAAIALGEGVLPPPATFDPMIVATAMAVHFALSVILALPLAFALGRLPGGLPAALLAGGAYGLALYAINFYGFTALFPWFAMARNLMSIAAHLVFGVVLAWSYLALARRA